MFFFSYARISLLGLINALTRVWKAAPERILRYRVRENQILSMRFQHPHEDKHDDIFSSRGLRIEDSTQTYIPHILGDAAVFIFPHLQRCRRAVFGSCSDWRQYSGPWSSGLNLHSCEIPMIYHNFGRT